MRPEITSKSRTRLRCCAAIVMASWAVLAVAQGPEGFGEITRPVSARTQQAGSGTSHDVARSNDANDDRQQAESYICAAYDVKNKHCLVREMTAQQRSRAIDTGIEVAYSMMGIQQEALRRASNRGITPILPPEKSRNALAGTGRNAVSFHSDPNSQVAAQPGMNGFQSCILERLSRSVEQTGAEPTPAQQLAVIKECEK